MCAALPPRLGVAIQQLAEQYRGRTLVRRSEDDVSSAALVGDDQVLVTLEMPSSPVDVLEQQPVCPSR